MCQNERAKALTSVAIINGAGIAATAASAFKGLALGWTCAGLKNAYAPPMMEKNGNGKCYTASSGTTCDKSHGSYFALCCCTAPGESPAAMCPVSAADCADGGLFWDATTFQCVGDAGLPLCQHGEESPLCRLNEPLNSTNQACPVGTWLPKDVAALLSASTWPCKPCAAGKRGVLPGMTSVPSGRVQELHRGEVLRWRRCAVYRLPPPALVTRGLEPHVTVRRYHRLDTRCEKREVHRHLRRTNARGCDCELPSRSHARGEQQDADDFCDLFDGRNVH